MSTAQVSEPPAAICVTPMSPATAVGAVTQGCIEPSAAVHICGDDATATPASPKVLSPQQLTVPPMSSAQEW